MVMSDNLRLILGLGLIGFAIYWSSRGENIVPSKLERPSDEIVELVSGLPTVEGRDSAEYAGMFYAMWQEYDKVDIKNNLELQYYLKYLGDEVLEGENSGKYPEWSPAAAAIMAEVVGKQDEKEPITEEENQKLKDLFYGFAWKMYNPEYDSVFEEYKDKTVDAIEKYVDKDDNPKPSPDSDKCICEGKGYVIHGDGHKTKCPCVESGESCKHNPKCGYSEPTPVVSVQDCPNGRCPTSRSVNSSRRGGFFYRLFGGR
jgi:hypothetical protein